MNNLKFVWASIRQQRLQSLLTVVLFTVSVGISIAVVSFTEQVGNRLEQSTSGIDLVVGAKGSPLQIILCSVFHADYPTGNIPLYEAERISRHRLVKDALPLALGDAYEGFRIVGSNQKFRDWYGCKVQEGQWWQQDLEVVLGSRVAERTGLKIGDSLASAHGLTEANDDHKDAVYRVVGILKSSGGITDDLILTSVSSLWKVHHLERKAVTVPSKLVPQADASDSTAEITSLLLRFRNPLAALQLPRIINQGTSMQAASPAFESSRLQNIIGVGTEVLSVFAWLVLGLSGFSIFISLLSGMKVRQFDLAVMRVMGASRIRIFSVIILEGFLLALLGATLGLLAGHSALSGIWFNEAISRNGISALFFSSTEWYIFCLAILVGIFGSLLPAIRAAKADVHSILTR